MEAKIKTIADFKLHEKDTGSADVQIALLTQRINHLTEHLQKNLKQRGSSRRGLPDNGGIVTPPVALIICTTLM